MDFLRVYMFFFFFPLRGKSIFLLKIVLGAQSKGLPKLYGVCAPFINV